MQNKAISKQQATTETTYLVISISHFHRFQGEGTERVDQVMQGHIIQVPTSQTDIYVG